MSMRPVFANLSMMGAGPETAREDFAVVQGTRLLYADLDAVKMDFAQTGQSLPDDSDLRCWLAEAGSVLSLANARESLVNEIPAWDGTLRTGLRPPRYGRAGIFDAPLSRSGGGLAIDVKGCGIALGGIPLRERRGSGTLLLHEAIQELINGRLLTRVFLEAGEDVECLPIYGLVDLGIKGWCSYFAREMPCVTLVRRAHLRPTDNNEIPPSGSDEEIAKHRIELILRRSGLSSAPMSCSVKFDGEGDSLRIIKNGVEIVGVPPAFIARFLDEIGIETPATVRLNNVQLTQASRAEPLSATLVDFGHYTAEPAYHGHHLVTLVSDRPFNWGSFVREEDPDWMQPDESMSVNQSLVGPVWYPRELALAIGYDLALRRERPGVEYAAVCLAIELDEGRLSVNELASAIDDFVDHAVSRHRFKDKQTA
ncbi:hypothetical protein [Rhizobium sp. FKY42]|uniref:hypothetical protein n=1 Tax=Rhizobium sp. FKY42 TaxID=2562310 RepID=UPI0010C093C8|nr:hypothetical protein [Rhizobium sp. FKY42]